MSRIYATAATLAALFLAIGLGLALHPTLAGGAAPAPPVPAAPAAAPDAFTFSPPVNTTHIGNVHPALIGAARDGTVNLPFVDQTNNIISNALNLTFNGPFSIEPLDNSPNHVGSERMVSDSRGRQHVVWYHNLSDGSGDTVVYYARKDPGTAGSHWQIQVVPGSETGAGTGGGYKVLGVARGVNDRVYVMWARNFVGAHVSWTDDGTHWSPVDTVPGPFSATATDFNIGATTGGYVFVGWFERESQDIFVQMEPPGGTWGPVTDVSNRPNHAQDYSPRFATAPDGGLRLAWSGYPSPSAAATDGFYREWTPAGGWRPTIVQLWNTAGGGNSRALEMVVDAGNVAHIVWDDATGRDQGNVTTYYMRGQGTSFTAPQAVFPQFGLATARYPYDDIGLAPDGSTKVHIATNSNVGPPFGSGLFDNYYTWTNTGIIPIVTPVVSATPVHSPTPCPAGQFTDVLSGSTYYTWVKDLTLRGAISGYGDCTFRPYNTITRGQAAKVLVVAFGFPLLNPATGHFSDVAHGSAFYQFIETAYAHNVISGYSDGTFRPFNYVTRGQISKMVALGKGWQLLNPTRPTFNDVAPGSTFYQYVETAYSLGVISGYTCGTNCLAFHVSDTANRGQASKIIDIAITATQLTLTPTPGPTNTPAPPTTTAPPATNTVLVPTSTPMPPSVSPVPPSATGIPASATPIFTSTPQASATPTPPVISGFNPNFVEQYDTLTQIDMSGQHFGVLTGTLSVNNVPATLVTWSDTLIQFQIGVDTPPTNPTTVRVTTSDGRIATSNAFVVLPRQRPYVFSYSPPTVPEGNTTIPVTMQGVRFGVVTGTVTLAGQYPATIQSWTDTAIIFHIAANTPAFNPIFVGINSNNGFYKEYGGFGVVGPSPTPTFTATPTVTATPAATATATPQPCVPRFTLVHAQQQQTTHQASVYYHVADQTGAPLTGLTVTYAFSNGLGSGTLADLGTGNYAILACSTLSNVAASVTVTTTNCSVTVMQTDSVAQVPSVSCP